jgi:hypothetical protein
LANPSNEHSQAALLISLNQRRLTGTPWVSGSEGVVS